LITFREDVPVEPDIQYVSVPVPPVPLPPPVPALKVISSPLYFLRVTIPLSVNAV